jgi:hypothetical protein
MSLTFPVSQLNITSSISYFNFEKTKLLLPVELYLTIRVNVIIGWLSDQLFIDVHNHVYLLASRSRFYTWRHNGDSYVTYRRVCWCDVTRRHIACIYHGMQFDHANVNPTSSIGGHPTYHSNHRGDWHSNSRRSNVRLVYTGSIGGHPTYHSNHVRVVHITHVYEYPRINIFHLVCVHFKLYWENIEQKIVVTPCYHTIDWIHVNIQLTGSMLIYTDWVHANIQLTGSMLTYNWLVPC